METVNERRRRKLAWLIEQEGGMDTPRGHTKGHYVIARNVVDHDQSGADPDQKAAYYRQIIMGQGGKNLADGAARAIEAAYQAMGRFGIVRGWFDADMSAPSITSDDTGTGEYPASTNARLTDTNATPMIVFSWSEVVKVFRAGIESALPDTFSVEITDDALIGRARRGDVVTLCRSRRDTAEAGDGVLVRTKNDAYLLRIYKPKGDGTFIAEATNPNFMQLRSDDDGLTILAVVVGVPSCMWSRL